MTGTEWTSGAAVDERVRMVLLGAFVVGLALSITLSQIVLTLLTVRWIVRWIHGGMTVGTPVRRSSPPLWMPFVAWITASLLAVSTSPNVIESGWIAIKGFLLIATFYVLLDALPEPESADRFFSRLFFIMAAVSVLSIAQVAFCPQQQATAAVLARVPLLHLEKVALKCHRAHGFYSIYMTLGGVLSLVLLMIVPRWLLVTEPASQPLGRWRLPAVLLNAIAFGLTQVRGAWIGFMIGLALMIGFLRRGRAVLIGGVALVLIALLLVPVVRRRAESMLDPADPTARERVSMWASGVSMARDHPWTGVGPGQLKHEYPRYVAPDALRKSRGHLHNAPLQILAERGALGLGAWLSIFVVFFRCTAKILAALPATAARERALTIGSLTAVAGFLVGGLTEYNFGDSEVVLVAYAVMAVPFVVERSLRGDRPRTATVKSA